MKKLWIWALISVLATAAFAAENQMTTTLDFSFYSQYMWRGFDLMDDKGTVQPSVNLDFGNGWNLNVFSAWPGSSGSSDWSTVNNTNFQYTLYYKGIMGEDCFQTNYSAGWRFYDYIDMPSNDADLQEGFIELAWPNIIGSGFVPRYAYYHMWPSEGSGWVRKYGGGIHNLGLDYTWTCECLPELPLKFSVDTVYNDGTGTVVDETNDYIIGPVDHDWSHVVWGLSTTVKCPLTGAKVTPGVWYQNSMEDSVNTEDELWAGLSYSLTF